ncbi:hypothetical protein FHS57_005036 [Runella defluvii]|uniref:Adhesin domain-containing protein n=1 Tax=Runella defluvii TaxID=370973 RepID=A0A7W5ZQP4_9BACT|nr:hypothetical protein [Runella defluvii]MBB3841015.1 hypothetical protein [Runella defluvii]
MKTASFFIALFVVATTVVAQDAKVFKTKFSGPGKSLVMNIDAKQLDMEGYNGDEVIIEAKDVPSVPKDAEGLRPLSATGVDNTNIGLSVNANGNTLTITTVMKGKTMYKIRVPKELGITVKKRHSCSCNENGMSISGMEGPLEINTNYEAITLTDVSGPIVANSQQGKIKVIFNDKMPDKPSSIVTYGNDVDVTVPDKAKVLFSISSANGNMFTDLDLKSYTTPTKTEGSVEEKRALDAVIAQRDADRDRTVTVNGYASSSGWGQSRTFSGSAASASAPAPSSVYVWDGNEWNANSIISTNGLSYAWLDSDKSFPKYVLNEPQTKIMLRTTQGNVYLRKKK